MQAELGRMVMAGVVVGMLGVGAVASARPAESVGRGRPGGGRREVSERPEQAERTRERESARQRDETQERAGAGDDEGRRKPSEGREGEGRRQPPERREGEGIWQRLRDTFGESIRTFVAGQQEARREGLRRIFAMEDAPGACRELIALIEGGQAAREAFFSGIHADMLALVETWLEERDMPAERRVEILARMEARHANRHSAIDEFEARLLDRLRRALERDDLTMEQLRHVWHSARQQAGGPREPRRDRNRDGRDRDADDPRGERRERSERESRRDGDSRDADDLRPERRARERALGEGLERRERT